MIFLHIFMNLQSSTNKAFQEKKIGTKKQKNVGQAGSPTGPSLYAWFGPAGGPTAPTQERGAGMRALAIISTEVGDGGSPLISRRRRGLRGNQEHRHALLIKAILMRYHG
jgi:hypothetical protein